MRSQACLQLGKLVILSNLALVSQTTVIWSNPPVPPPSIVLLIKSQKEVLHGFVE